MKRNKRPVLLLTLAQLCCIVATVAVLFFFFTPAVVLFSYIEQADMLAQDNTLIVTLASVMLCLRDAVAGGCLVCVGMEALGICGRVKKSSAFSEKNVSALGRITIELTLAGVVTLLFGNSLIPFLLTDLPAISPVVEHLLLPFMLLVIALMGRSVQVLMRRALSMQEESDLTV